MSGRFHGNHGDDVRMTYGRDVVTGMTYVGSHDVFSSAPLVPGKGFSVRVDRRVVGYSPLYRVGVTTFDPASSDRSRVWMRAQWVIPGAGHRYHGDEEHGWKVRDTGRLTGIDISVGDVITVTMASGGDVTVSVNSLTPWDNPTFSVRELGERTHGTVGDKTPDEMGHRTQGVVGERTQLWAVFAVGKGATITAL